jgi:hypothetical protein
MPGGEADGARRCAAPAEKVAQEASWREARRVAFPSMAHKHAGSLRFRARGGS